MCVFAYFQFDRFPKSKIDSESRFEMRMSISIFKTYFLKSCGHYFKKSKKEFSIVFSKSDLTGEGYIFDANIFLKKPNFPK